MNYLYLVQTKLNLYAAGKSNLTEFVLLIERQIRHLLITLWSAQANTAPGLFWMLFYILKHPNAKSNIIQEFDCFVNKQNLTRESDQNNNQSETNQNESLALTKTDLDKLYVLGK